MSGGALNHGYLAAYALGHAASPPPNFEGAHRVGCFHIIASTPCRWLVYNEITQLSHATYGAQWDEIEAEYTRQTESWRRRLEGSKLPGSAWRTRWTKQVDEAKAARAQRKES